MGTCDKVVFATVRGCGAGRPLWNRIRDKAAKRRSGVLVTYDTLGDLVLKFGH